ncbi:Unknown protein sequence [Pseudomonas coronafaciens pv. oryzae]|nr:Unknown protein sequence [Pseudomonas coronafaciens pv. oryzae]
MAVTIQTLNTTIIPAALLTAIGVHTWRQEHLNGTVMIIDSVTDKAISLC